MTLRIVDGPLLFVDSWHFQEVRLRVQLWNSYSLNNPPNFDAVVTTEIQLDVTQDGYFGANQDEQAIWNHTINYNTYTDPYGTPWPRSSNGHAMGYIEIPIGMIGDNDGMAFMLGYIADQGWEDLDVLYFKINITVVINGATFLFDSHLTLDSTICAFQIGDVDGSGEISGGGHDEASFWGDVRAMFYATVPFGCPSEVLDEAWAECNNFGGDCFCCACDWNGNGYCNYDDFSNLVECLIQPGGCYSVDMWGSDD